MIGSRLCDTYPKVDEAVKSHLYSSAKFRSEIEANEQRLDVFDPGRHRGRELLGRVLVVAGRWSMVDA